MRRFAKLLLWAALAAAAGVLSLLPGQVQGQVGGGRLPPGVIAKDPAESELSITVSMGQGVYIEGATAAEFVRLQINQAAFVYLYEIAPSGEVRLLFPNRMATSNFLAAGEYAFPEDFMPGFPIGPEGVYTVQAIATLLPVELRPGAELFRRLGSDPDQVRRGVELLIAQSRLTAVQWTAAWTQYPVVKTLPTAGGTGRVTIRVVDPEGQAIRDALIKVERIDDQGRLISVLLDWTEVGEMRILHPEEGHYRLLAKRPLFYIPDPQTVCTVFRRPMGPEVSGTCEIPVQAGDDLGVTFTLEPATPAADFRVTRPKLPNPYCVGRRVEFDASMSRPREQIRQYLWDFGDGTTRLETEPTTTHIFRHPKVYSVTLTIFYQGGVTRSVTKTVEVVEAGDPKCAVPFLGGEKFGKAEFVLQPPNTIDFEVRNGYAIVPVPGLALPTGSTAIRLSFQYMITAFPALDVQQARAFVTSYVSVVFTDAQGNAITSAPPTVLYAIEPGKFPDLLKPQLVSITLPVPAGARGLTVFAVTNVLATPEATEDPMTIQYSSFRVDPNPPPETCATLTSGQLIRGQFVEKQIFLLGEQIAFRFTNNCSQALTLRSDGWWRILDTQTGREVFRTAPATVSVSIPPGEALEWTWDQRNAQGQFIEPNRIYRVEVETQAGAVYPAPFVVVFP